MDKIYLYLVTGGVAFSFIFALLDCGIAAFYCTTRKPWKLVYIISILGIIPFAVFGISKFNVLYGAISLIFGLLAIITFIREVRKIVKANKKAKDETNK
jgi:biotin transporter BioY